MTKAVRRDGLGNAAAAVGLLTGLFDGVTRDGFVGTACRETTNTEVFHYETNTEGTDGAEDSAVFKTRKNLTWPEGCTR